MITGRDTLQEINDYVLQAESKIEYADREMEKLTSRMGSLRLEKAEQFQKLARFRLGEMNAGNMVARLNKAHQVVQAYFDYHKQAIAELESNLEQLNQSQQKLEQQRESRAVTGLHGFPGQTVTVPLCSSMAECGKSSIFFGQVRVKLTLIN